MGLYWCTVKKLGEMRSLEKTVPVKVNVLSFIIIYSKDDLLDSPSIIPPTLTILCF